MYKNNSNDEDFIDTELDVMEDEAYAPIPKRRWKVLLKVVLFFSAFIGVALFGLIIMSSVSMNGLESVQSALDKFDKWFMFIRLLLIIIAITYWENINTWLARRNDWSDLHLQRVINGRWRTLGILLFIELVLVQQIHEYIFNIIG